MVTNSHHEIEQNTSWIRSTDNKAKWPHEVTIWEYYDAGGLCHYAGTKEYIVDPKLEVKTGADAAEVAETWKRDNPVRAIDSACVVS
mmetsp:Transcript_54584/g.150232  ORF Transcript_54584/g.150232 Transcript_54584/m.150232 type:complete len:87 (+) Transcript_54584:3-263(+)